MQAYAEKIEIQVDKLEEECAKANERIIDLEEQLETANMISQQKTQQNEILEKQLEAVRKSLTMSSNAESVTVKQEPMEVLEDNLILKTRCDYTEDLNRLLTDQLQASKDEIKSLQESLQYKNDTLAQKVEELAQIKSNLGESNSRIDELNAKLQAMDIFSDKKEKRVFNFFYFYSVVSFFSCFVNKLNIFVSEVYRNFYFHADILYSN